MVALGWQRTMQTVQRWHAIAGAILEGWQGIGVRELANAGLEGAARHMQLEGPELVVVSPPGLLAKLAGSLLELFQAWHRESGCESAVLGKHSHASDCMVIRTHLEQHGEKEG